MQVVRLYDPTRQPHGWLQIIRPNQFAAFATLLGSGAVCDADGVPTNADEASCVIFDTLPEAEAFCRERVAQNSRLQFDILDANGPGRAPLFTIVNPSHAATLEQSPAKMRRNRRVATVLLMVGPALVWFDWTYYEGVMVMPTIVGINAVLIAVRLLMMNGGHRSAERTRQARVGKALGQPSGVDPPRGA